MGRPDVGQGADSDELAGVLESIGVRLAEVGLDDLARWAAITPALAALVQSLRRLREARDGAGSLSPDPVPDSAPPIVRAREFGMLAAAVVYPPGQGSARACQSAGTDTLALRAGTAAVARVLRGRLAEKS